MSKFEETGDLGMLEGRGWKRIPNEIAEEVALALIEKSLVPNILQQVLSGIA